jgi:hypothetical protein
VRASTISTLVLGTFALLVPTAQAAAPKTVASCDAARVDKAAGVARSLSDCGTANLSRGAEGAARQALGRLSGALGVKRTTSDLALMRARDVDGGKRVRFQQYVGGVPVRNGQVAIALGDDGSVLQVASGASTDRTLDTTPRVGRADALLTARRRVPSGFDTVVPARTTLVADPAKNGALTLAWEVVLATRSPRADWHVLVSASSGDVIEAANQLWRVDGTAKTYSPNPVQMTGNTGLRDLADADQPALTNARGTFALTDLAAGTSLIRGTFANPTSKAVAGCDPSLPYIPGQASSPTRTYDLTRSQDAFEEAQAYLAVTGVQRTYAALGFPGIFPGPVPINVHCIPDDNSFFLDEDGALHLGDGGVDDAEDSDVTVHEFGHATQAAQVPGWGPGQDTEQRAMGEGFGDFLAAFYYLQAGNAAYQSARRFCVMEWDATSYSPVTGGNAGSGCARWVDGTDENNGTDIGQYPGSPTEEHDGGRYWSATLTCVFEGMEDSLPSTAAARNRILTLALAHHEDLVPTAEDGAFEQAIAALRAEDTDRFGGNDLALIDDCAQQRFGLIPDTTPPTLSGALSPASADGANGWYRTAPAFTWTFSDPDSKVIARGCANTASAADTPGTTLTCTVISRGGMASQSLTYKKDATPPTLGVSLTTLTPAVGQAITATPGASDATSGVASASCGTPDTSTAGTKNVTCTATDNAGNAATQAIAFTVGGGGGDGSTTTPPKIKLSRLRLARNGNISFRLRFDRSVRTRVSAKSGKVKFRTQSKRFVKDRNIKVTLKLTKKQRAAWLKKLRTGRRQTVTLSLKPTGFKTQKIKLRVRRR